jgi:hypothetical protein
MCLSADSLGLSSLVQATQGKVLACVSGEGIIPFVVSCICSDFPLLAYHLANPSRDKGQPIIILVRLNLRLHAICKAEASVSSSM